jgi:hypothetical protein
VLIEREITFLSRITPYANYYEELLSSDVCTYAPVFFFDYFSIRASAVLIFVFQVMPNDVTYYY